MKKIFLRVQLFVLFLLLIFSSLQSQTPVDMVDISDMDSTIVIDLRYATADNFLNDTLYSANICLLRKPVAERLVQVQKYLREKGLGLKVWDGYRPLFVQKKMWETLPDSKFVANPKHGSNHNRGAAVDVTLVDLEGKELEMPTGFDDFSEKAHIKSTNISDEAKKNREILQEAMKRFGFNPILSEWWHFNDKDIKKYSVMDIPLNYFEAKMNK
ncbi:M15 family metallopeptidase [candidate division KSB1 bacterium]|nr:M15 family metallopeptidase [candidate division KSB1 bacterium]MBL7092537.1 M15 family metallopeptidase [candidate division KSB1 bacterium]